MIGRSRHHHMGGKYTLNPEEESRSPLFLPRRKIKNKKNRTVWRAPNATIIAKWAPRELPGDGPTLSLSAGPHCWVLERSFHLIGCRQRWDGCNRSGRVRTAVGSVGSLSCSSRTNQQGHGPCRQPALKRQPLLWRRQTAREGGAHASISSSQRTLEVVDFFYIYPNSVDEMKWLNAVSFPRTTLHAEPRIDVSMRSIEHLPSTLRLHRRNR